MATYTVLPFRLPATLGPRPPAPPEPAVDPRLWTSFDPNLRIEQHANETAYTVVVTYLPTGQQASCGRYPHMIENRVAAIAALRRRVM